MVKTSREKVFVHFDDTITNFGLANQVIAGIFKKEEIEFYSSSYIYNNRLDFKEKNEKYFGIYLECLGFAVLEVKNSYDVERLEQSDMVVKVNPDKIVKIEKLDPDFNCKPQNWGIKKLKVEYSDKSGKNVKIAILDSGIDLKHSGFKIDAYRTHNFVYPDRNVQDYYGHGTHVAGIACGGYLGDKRIGVAPNATVYIGKILDDDGSLYGITSLVEGLDWACMFDCKIINLSLGIPTNENEPVNEDLQKAVNAVYKKGIIVVAAVGNGSRRQSGVLNPIDSPSNCKHVLGISAIDKNNKVFDEANSTKNDGQEVDFIAPGVKILSLYPVELSSKDYACLDGTSMATPFISGLLALYYEDNLHANPDQIVELLKSNVAPIGVNIKDAKFGMPIFNSKSTLTSKTINMSSTLDYQGSIVLQNNQGLQEIYSSQNYGTFYSIYLTFECRPNPKDKKLVDMTNIKFSIVNYKGLLNIGIVRAEDELKKDLEFKIDVRAMERNRDFPLIDGKGDPKTISFDPKKVKNIIINRRLLKMTDFNPNLSPNHPNNTVFDDEFYYRDGLEFDPKSKSNVRIPRGGMEGYGGASSGKRCYQITLKITE